MLTMVTLTGADNTVDPANLAELSKEFPFVEWGILIGSGTGNRLPSRDWIRDLIECRHESDNKMNLSLHICGSHLRTIAAGGSSLMDYIGPGLCAFDRCQLNWHGQQQPAAVSENVLNAFCRLAPWEPQIIFQLDGVNDDLWRGAARRFLVAGLFDASHGAGALPGEWPPAKHDFACGWAGGLGPDNVVVESGKIAACCHASMQHWIDMETKLRATDDGHFDLGKCRNVLEQMAPLIGK